MSTSPKLYGKGADSRVVGCVLVKSTLFKLLMHP